MTYLAKSNCGDSTFFSSIALKMERQVAETWRPNMNMRRSGAADYRLPKSIIRNP